MTTANYLPRISQPNLTKEDKRKILAEVKRLTNHGLHLQASTLYNTHFPL